MRVEVLEIHWHGNRERINSIDFFPNSNYLVSSGVEDEEKLYIHVILSYEFFNIGKLGTKLNL